MSEQTRKDNDEELAQWIEELANEKREEANPEDID